MRPWLALVLAAIVVLLVVTGDGGERAAPRNREAPAAHVETGTPAWSPPPALPSTDPLRLEGVVIELGGTPVAGARVTLGDGRATLTEADGSFAFPGLAQGQYTVTAERDGWFGIRDVPLDDDTGPVTVELVLGVTLVVTVVDEAGWPIADANVRVASRDYQTGPDGIARAHAGPFWDGGIPVSVTAEGHASRHESVNLRHERAVTIEKTVVLASGAAISGRVVDDRGVPVPEARVELASSELGISETVWADEHGVWQIEDLGKATYLARASSPSAVPAGGETVVHDGVHPTTGIVVRVVAGAEIAGDVVDASGKPLAGAVIRASRAVEPADVGEALAVIASTDDAGRFAVPVLPAGTYTLSVTTDTHGAVDQVTTLATGDQARVRFVVVASTIEGIVVDARGQPVADATIVARSEEPRGYTVTYSDERGRFVTGGLPPGRYRVTASRRHSMIDGPAIEVQTGTRGARLVALDEPDRS